MTEHYLDRLARTINENWNAPALTDFYLTEDGTVQDTSRGNHYTYGEMYMEMLRLTELFKELGLQKGDHIAICGANSAHWGIAYLAIAAYQGVAVTILHSQAPEDIAYQIEFSDAKLLFSEEMLWEDIRSFLQGDNVSKLSYIISLTDWSHISSRPIESIQSAMIKDTTYVQGQCQISHRELDDLAMICFTSGSTGVAKGVMLTYRCLSTNIDYLCQQFANYRTFGAHVAYIPYSHLGGLVLELLEPLCSGTKCIIIQHPMKLSGLVDCYNLFNPTIIMMVPAILSAILKTNHDYSNLFGSNLQLLGIGGAKLSEYLEKQLMENHVPLAIGYGTTECSPFISIAMPYNFRQHSAGLIVPTLECMCGADGEILVKGENVMLGYYKNPEATAKKIDKDGWLHTGDKGYLDEDGYLYVEGRLEQDMIVLPNGENIHPDNIESKINALPEVAESIVVAREGKLVAIVVVSGELSADSRTALRLSILRSVNAQLPMYAQIYDIEWSEEPLARTAKQTLKRHLYK